MRGDDVALSPETAQVVREIGNRLARMDAEIATLRRGLVRTPQLGQSSLEPGEALEVRDADGRVRGRLGWQADGSVGYVTEGGDPPSAPTVPVVAPAPVGLMVQWDGALADGLALPSDFDHVSVHVSQQSGFTPSQATFQGTIPRVGGVCPVVPLEVGTTYYVVLVGVTTGGVEGVPSAEASGVPESVGGVPGPGSITETEIADDAISTPKLQALAVNAAKIAADAINAGHIQAGAVTAGKLAAEIVLGSRIIAGDPAGSRVELDTGGLRGYNADNMLVFAIDASGSALFSGDIVGAEITGSRMQVGQLPGGIGAIEAIGDAAQNTVTASTNARAQLRAGPTQAEFSGFSDVTDPSTPATGFLALPGTVQFALNSVNDDPLSPGVYGIAVPQGAWLTAQAERGVATSQAVSLVADAAGARVRIVPPKSAVGGADADDGLLTGIRQAGTDSPLVSLQSPTVTSGAGAGRRALLHVMGSNGDNLPVGRLTYWANRHQFRNDSAGSVEQTDDGFVWITDQLSIYASRHTPKTSALITNPAFGTTGAYVDFTAAQWPAIPFKTSWSGMTRVAIMTAGINHQTANSSLAVGFRVSGGATVPAALSRSAYLRSRGAGVNEPIPAYAEFILDLPGNTDCVLTPAWRISGGSSSTTSFYQTLANVITVEPLM